MKTNNEKKENKIGKWVRRLILLVCICVFCYSAFNLVSIWLDYKTMDDANASIQSKYTSELPKKYLDIDWDSLSKRNSDVKAWIQIPDTNVDYPVLQGATNDTYIHSDIDKKSFRAGSIFIQADVKDPFNQVNTVIYGHNMKNGSMFADIKSYTEQDFANKHPYVYIYMPDSTVSIYKVVSAHIISAESNLYNTSYTNYQEYYTEMLKNSNISVDFDQTQNNPVITLSTCTSGGSANGKRNVVHAVLQEKGINPKTNTRPS
ncbi:MAG: class B sortase [Thomasclavelia sp.]|jgi:sortase B|nr:class B sortase [Thomasclavelia sp.]